MQRDNSGRAVKVERAGVRGTHRNSRRTRPPHRPRVRCPLCRRA